MDNPNLISKKSMAAMSSTLGSRSETVHEIFTKINNAKDKPKKIEVLKKFDKPYIRSILKAAFDPKIVWDIPEGTPPYIANEAPLGTEHTILSNQVNKLYHFLKGGNNTLNKAKKEIMFIQMLEGLCAEEAEFLITAVSKKINNKYKGFTANLVKEAFNWDDDFMKK